MANGIRQTKAGVVQTESGVVQTAATGTSIVEKQNLVAWYPFEDGGTANDAATTTDFGDATPYDGTVNGATHLSSGGVTDINAGASSGAFEFVSDRIDIGNIPPIEGVGQITVCAWVDADSANTDKEVVGDFSPDGSFSNTIAMSFNAATKNQAVVYRVRNGGSRTNVSASYSTTSGYEHFAFTFDSGSMVGYKNGSSIGNTNGNATTTPTAKLNLGGRFSSNNDFEGRVDDVRFYDTALTGTQINNIYQNTQP